MKDESAPKGAPDTFTTPTLLLKDRGDAHST